MTKQIDNYNRSREKDLDILASGGIGINVGVWVVGIPLIGVMCVITFSHRFEVCPSNIKWHLIIYYLIISLINISLCFFGLIGKRMILSDSPSPDLNKCFYTAQLYMSIYWLYLMTIIKLFPNKYFDTLAHLVWQEFLNYIYCREP